MNPPTSLPSTPAPTSSPSAPPSSSGHGGSGSDDGSGTDDGSGDDVGLGDDTAVATSTPSTIRTTSGGGTTGGDNGNDSFSSGSGGDGDEGTSTATVMVVVVLLLVLFVIAVLAVRVHQSRQATNQLNGAARNKLQGRGQEAGEIEMLNLELAALHGQAANDRPKPGPDGHSAQIHGASTGPSTAAAAPGAADMTGENKLAWAWLGAKTTDSGGRSNAVLTASVAELDGEQGTADGIALNRVFLERTSAKGSEASDAHNVVLEGTCLAETSFSSTGPTTAGGVSLSQPVATPRPPRPAPPPQFGGEYDDPYDSRDPSPRAPALRAQVLAVQRVPAALGALFTPVYVAYASGRECTQRLADKAVGTFIVRSSSKMTGQLAISIRVIPTDPKAGFTPSALVVHKHIVYHAGLEGGYQLLDTVDKRFASLNALVQFYATHPVESRSHEPVLLVRQHVEPPDAEGGDMPWLHIGMM